MIYYTADLHFGHTNVIKHCARPFRDADAMDSALISNWNDRVRKSDTIYIVGDLFYRNRRSVLDYLAHLPGHKHLILGNHDCSWIKKTSGEWMMYFESVSNLLECRDQGRSVVLCHYPMMTWRDSGRGAYMVYGHIHNSINASFWPLIRGNPLMLNAGVDVNDFQPVTLDEMKVNNERFKGDHDSIVSHEPLVT